MAVYSLLMTRQAVLCHFIHMIIIKKKYTRYIGIQNKTLQTEYVCNCRPFGFQTVNVNRRMEMINSRIYKETYVNEILNSY